MERMIKIARSFYGLAMIIYGVQQFAYSDFRMVFLPPWQSNIPLLVLWAWLFGVGLIVTGLAIILQKKAREVSLITGTIFLILFCLVQVPYEMIDPHSYSRHFGSWVNALKEVALSGGAFVIAGSFYIDPSPMHTEPFAFKIPEKIAPFGILFFALVMASFGIGHFMYAGYLTQLVPERFPDHIFWVYFAGTALTGAGVFIILDIRTKAIATLLGIMIFLWVFLVHIPRAISHPFIDRGNEVSSVFDALAFSGTAFLIALTAGEKKNDIY